MRKNCCLWIKSMLQWRQIDKEGDVKMTKTPVKLQNLSVRSRIYHTLYEKQGFCA